MSVLFRALVVVGVLTYFAARQPNAELPTGNAALRPSLDTTSLSAAWNTIAAGARDEVGREAASAFAKRLAAVAPSRDTLEASDRRPAWRGSTNP